MAVQSYTRRVGNPGTLGVSHRCLTSTSLANLRQNMSIVLLNEQGQAVRRYNFYQCWVSEYQALPFLDTETSMTAFERIRVENEGWERDQAVVPPTD
jgi:phage tail-like protein